MRATGIPKRGITLLEIMISIGVVGIGLLGVAALIPLAHYKAAEGVREDRKALYGKRAFREFFVQGFDRPGSMTASPVLPVPKPYWLHFQGTSTTPATVYNVAGDGSLIHQTYCFDPLGVAAAAELNQVNSVFPLLGGNLPDLDGARVSRITVLQHSPSLWHDFLIAQGAAPTVANQQVIALVSSASPMTRLQADEIFRIRDDLEIQTLENLNEGTYAVAVQPGAPIESTQRVHLRESINGNLVGVKPVAGGSFSWMATLVPEVDIDYRQAAQPFLTNRYMMSVVVFNDRDLSGRFREEVVAQLINPTVMLGATKQIALQELASGTPLVPEDTGVRTIRQGDWIALMQNPLPASNIPRYTRLKWYQVIGADAVDGDADQTRELTLAGPDWNINLGLPVFAVYLRNVVSVYEKTIELQR